jgi:hemerythrin-like domain-containing protein
VIATLLDEHQGMLTRLDRLAALVAPAAGSDRAGLEEIRDLAAALIGAEPHHRREELVLFPALMERGVHGPPEVMAAEHVELRERKRALHDAAQRMLADGSENWSTIRTRARALIDFLRQHISKEDGVLFPMALQAIHEPSAWAELRRRCDAIGYCCDAAHGAHANEGRGARSSPVQSDTRTR